jgi:hypothetical protein
MGCGRSTSKLGPVGRIALACVAGLALLGLGACGEEELRREIMGEIAAATAGRVVDFKLTDARVGQPSWVWLSPPEGEEDVTPEDIAAAMAVIDAHQSDRRLRRGGIELAVDDDRSLRQPLVNAAWWETADGSDVELASISGASVVYGEWMCQFPHLRQLSMTGPGSDFSRVGECSPALEILEIGAWGESTGHEGLGDLKNLVGLSAFEGVEPGEFPEFEGLTSLSVELVEDTDANRAAIEAKVPGSDVTFQVWPTP